MEIKILTGLLILAALCCLFGIPYANFVLGKNKNKPEEKPNNDNMLPPRPVLKELTPGSFEAIQQGCKCSYLRNQYGLGVTERNGRTVYDINEHCLLHGSIPPTIQIFQIKRFH